MTDRKDISRRQYETYAVRGAIVVLIGIIAFILATGGGRLSLNGLNNDTPTDDTTLTSSIYDIKVERLQAPVDPGQGGAVAALGDDVFLVTRRGDFYRLDETAGGFSPIGLAAPNQVIEKDVFYKRQKDFDALGYKDLLVQHHGGSEIEFTLSEARVDVEKNCVAVSVYQTRIEIGALTTGNHGPSIWNRVWESTPCISSNGGSFPLQSGGAMAFTEDGRLAIFVGDFGSDGHNRDTPNVDPQDPANDYGKVIAIDLETGNDEILTLGHRNPGGLTTDSAGTLWNAENAAQGGDEINMIVQGGNYGWPLETYGTHYGMKTWPPDTTPGVQDRFTRPTFAFVPSLAPSALALMTGEEFPAWRGDLILGVMKYKRLVRLRIRDDRVVFAEPIFLRSRVRDLTVDARGRIYVKDDNVGAVYRLTNAGSADPTPGTKAFAFTKAGCAACHALPGDEDSATATGPHLAGLMGRRIAAERSFAYSPALRARGGIWDRETLTAYLTDPQSFAPGTTMPAPDLTAEDIEALLDAIENEGS